MKIYHKIWNKFNPDDPIIKGDGCVIHHKGKKNGMYGIKMPDKHKKLLSIINKERMLSDKNPMKGKYGDKHLIFGGINSDKVKAKISKANKGENNGMSKLTHKIVNWIRDVLNSEEYKEAKKKKLINQAKLAKIFGVGQSVISEIKNNKIWKDIENVE